MCEKIKSNTIFLFRKFEGKLFGTKGFIGASNMNSFVDELPADRLVNDRNIRAIETEKLPQVGGVKAALASLRRELPLAH